MTIEERVKALEKAKQELEDLSKNDPETAKILARVALIKTGVLNENGTPKEQIVTEPHIGFYENNMSYEEVVDTMRDCLSSLRELGNGDLNETRVLVLRSLIDSGYIDKNGHIIAREKRAPQVEAFFRRLEAETGVSKKQRVRK